MERHQYYDKLIKQLLLYGMAVSFTVMNMVPVLLFES